MDSLTIQEIKDRGLLLFECISGSRAYGTQVPGSDTDYKGVYMAPLEQLYGFNKVGQVNEDNNDKAYYELGKYLELLSKSNPNMLEMLNTPEDCLLYKHPLMDLLEPSMFLSKACKETFAGYAKTQIRKARGLKKKILNPVEPKRKTVLDFCYIIEQHRSKPAQEWLLQKGWRASDCGLVSINHAQGLFALYHSHEDLYKGILGSENANEVSFSSVAKEEKPVAYLAYNKDAYATHCKNYKEYWAWVEKRNDERYQNTLSHGKQYDSKNMMHTFRLLHMAEEIGRDAQIQVRRQDRAFLLDVRKGAYDYEELLEMAEAKLKDIEEAYANSTLPERVDEASINQLLCEMRKRFYQDHRF